MRDDMAETVAESEAQQFTLPVYGGWVEFAHLIDGYAICREMGIEDANAWAYERQKQFEQEGQISLPVIEARVLLFLIARAMRFGSSEPYQFVSYLLSEIARLTQQSYTPLTETDITQMIEAQAEIYRRMIKKPGDKHGEE